MVALNKDEKILTAFAESELRECSHWVEDDGNTYMTKCLTCKKPLVRKYTDKDIKEICIGQEYLSEDVYIQDVRDVCDKCFEVEKFCNWDWNFGQPDSTCVLCEDPKRDYRGT
jgi:hypothetical protein|tara:strand:+ start:771 stop:1109 length:339 start_codon:yes stop_codon:yes gene_type:complete